MNKQTYIDFARAVASHNPEASTADLMQLMSLARRLHHLNELYCYDNQDYDDINRKRNQIVTMAKEIAYKFGARVLAQYDPRCWPLVLYYPDTIGYDDPELDGGDHGIGVPPR
jgi:hypothetical protein